MKAAAERQSRSGVGDRQDRLKDTAGEPVGQPGAVAVRTDGPIGQDQFDPIPAGGGDVPGLLEPVTVKGKRLALHVRRQGMKVASKDETAAGDPIGERHQHIGSETERSGVRPCPRAQNGRRVLAEAGFRRRDPAAQIRGDPDPGSVVLQNQQRRHLTTRRRYPDSAR